MSDNAIYEHLLSRIFVQLDTGMPETVTFCVWLVAHPSVDAIGAAATDCSWQCYPTHKLVVECRNSTIAAHWLHSSIAGSAFRLAVDSAPQAPFRWHMLQV